MLVCNVSLRAPRAAISVAIAEAASANATASVLAVFDALVDDPAAAFETVDATVGEFLIEAASASDTVDLGGSTFAVAVDEVVSAADAPDGTTIGVAPTRSAMIPGVFVNPGTSREAHVIGTMVNL
jgi:hypothetical protein